MIYFSLIFIVMYIYYILNYRNLDKPFIQRDRNSKLDLIYYILKVCSWVWIITGVFFTNNIFFIILLSTLVLKVPLYHLNSSLGSIWHRLIPPIHIITLFLMLLTH
jgi:hypothetical protein